MEKLLANKEIDFSSGLTNSQVEERTKQGLVNTTLTKASKTYTQIFVGNICTWFNFICFLMATLLICVGSYANASFIVIFMANLLIGLVQEIRAKRMVDKISLMNQTQITALRENKEIQLDVEKVVKDEILFFESGNQICADCVLIDGNIEANESLITGESKPVKKFAGDTLLGGSFVISGKCKAQAVNVGLNTYSSTLVKKAREFKSNQSEILKTLNTIIKTIGIILLPLGILTFFDSINYNFVNADFKDAITRTSGSIIGMMPVGMFLLTSVSLVVGVLKLARRKTLAQDAYAIEMLARSNVLCLDKTGTLTDGTMTVCNVLPINSSAEDINTILKNYINNIKANNQTQTALKNYFGVEANFKATATIEFSSERKYSAVTLEELGTFMLGAPEFVNKKLDKDILHTIKEFTSDGFRVLLLAKNKTDIKKEEIKVNNTPLAIITIQDNIRPDARDTIEWFNNNDVQVKIISGDNVDTVSTISKKVGVKDANKCISLEGLSEEEVRACATKYNVFGRVTPEQKCIIVKALKESGNKVAMTGDGVNDILALKEADCSIAMASGSEATRSASSLVMLDNNFATMPKVVAEGRRVINNISKSSALFLTKTFFAMFLTIFTLISPSYNFPLVNTDIMLWECFFIGVSSFFLTLQPNEDRIKGSFIANLTSKALPGALVLFLGAIACYIFCSLTGTIETTLGTMISYTVTIGAFFIMLELCLPLDCYRSIVCFGSLICCVAIYLFEHFALNGIFLNYSPIAPTSWIFLVVSWICIALLFALFKFLFEKFFETDFSKKLFRFKRENKAKKVKNN